jgi:hypothetical protein
MKETVVYFFEQLLKLLCMQSIYQLVEKGMVCLTGLLGIGETSLEITSE